MTTQDIILALNAFIPTGEEDIDTIKMYELTNELKKNEDAYLACENLITIFEKYPQHDFGHPGPIVHTLENYSGKYEDYLFQSLDRKPTYMTLWMFNRIINGEKNEALRQKYIGQMKNYSEHPQADDYAKEEALQYYNYESTPTTQFSN